uniref:Uncharacterized protein n=1 Tax=Anguilla anguilla TaxID=7936 RepID=A0A0E9TRU7_ANGAN
MQMLLLNAKYYKLPQPHPPTYLKAICLTLSHQVCFK